ncbi:sodium:solute symporter family protein [Streptomonospora sediminis]
MDSTWLIVAVIVLYLAVMAVISFTSARSAKTPKSFADGGRVFPAVFIGFLLGSEFIGTSATIGTAQEAYSSGISSAWNIASLGAGFILFSLLLARKFSDLGENTISGALSRAYGERVRTATSVIMVCALLIVSVATYSGGGAVLASLLGIDRVWAIGIVGVLATVYVSVGGMRSVVYTNLVHALTMFAGIVLLAVIGTGRAGGLGELRAALPEQMFAFDGVGWAQIMAWMIAGVGATFATQYVVQAITTVGDRRKAQTASTYAAVFLLPYGVLAALVGMCSAVLYPGIDSIRAIPALAVDLDPLLSGLVIAGLSGAMFGTIAALTVGASTLLLKDFYQPYFNRERSPAKDLVFIRTATAVAGLLPITLALFASDILAVTFLAKSLRAALAVLVVLMFYAPRFGTRGGAFWSILIALPATLGWYLVGEPYGIDNAYIAVATPLVVMAVSGLLPRRRAGAKHTAGSAADEPAAEPEPAPAQQDAPAPGAGTAHRPAPAPDDPAP